MILTDETRPHSQNQFLNEAHATHKDFNLADIPEEWRNARYSLAVGRRMWEGFEEETKYWTKQEEKQQEWEELLEKKRQLEEAKKT